MCAHAAAARASSRVFDSAVAAVPIGTACGRLLHGSAQGGPSTRPTAPPTTSRPSPASTPSSRSSFASRTPRPGRRRRSGRCRPKCRRCRPARSTVRTTELRAASIGASPSAFPPVSLAVPVPVTATAVAVLAPIPATHTHRFFSLLPAPLPAHYIAKGHGKKRHAHTGAVRTRSRVASRTVHTQAKRRTSRAPTACGRRRHRCRAQRGTVRARA